MRLVILQDFFGSLSSLIITPTNLWWLILIGGGSQLVYKLVYQTLSNTDWFQLLTKTQGFPDETWCFSIDPTAVRRWRTCLVRLLSAMRLAREMGWWPKVTSLHVNMDRRLWPTAICRPRWLGLFVMCKYGWKVMTHSHICRLKTIYVSQCGLGYLLRIGL